MRSRPPASNAESIDAYRQAASSSRRNLGEAWWSLANLKTFRFSAGRDRRPCARSSQRDRSHRRRPLSFPVRAGQGARGRRRVRRARSSTTPRATRLRRRLIRYDADENAAHVERSKRLFTREFFAERAGWGCAAPDPIFIVGLPRSGSTLIEQILAQPFAGRRHAGAAGHRACSRAPSAARTTRSDGSAYPRALAKFSAEELRALGRTVPRADAHPAQDDRAVLHRQDAEQLRARGTHPPDPAEREDHRCAPPSARLLLLRLQAALRARPELHLRPRASSAATTATTSSSWRISTRCCRAACIACSTKAWSRTPRARCAGCSTTAACRSRSGVLRFHENQRAVRTASSEQVRQPIFREGVEQWRHFDHGSDPSGRRSGLSLDRIPPRRSFDSVAYWHTLRPQLTEQRAITS